MSRKRPTGARLAGFPAAALVALVALSALGEGSALSAARARADDAPPTPAAPAPAAPAAPAPPPAPGPATPDPGEEGEDAATADTRYFLPWTAGERYVCVQGNHGLVSHNGSQAYAFDFAMPVGTLVRAARGGVVVSAVDRHSRRGTDAPNNKVGIDHGDGTTGWYLHIRTGGARVVVGQRVLRGEVLAESGNVGRSLMPHLHFHVTRAGATIPVRFADVEADDGVPRLLGSYASGNEPPPGSSRTPAPADPDPEPPSGR